MISFATFLAFAAFLPPPEPPPLYWLRAPEGAHEREFLVREDGSESDTLVHADGSALTATTTGPCTPGLYTSKIQYDASIGRFYGSAIITCSNGVLDQCKASEYKLLVHKYNPVTHSYDLVSDSGWNTSSEPGCGGAASMGKTYFVMESGTLRGTWLTRWVGSTTLTSNLVVGGVWPPS